MSLSAMYGSVQKRNDKLFYIEGFPMIGEFHFIECPSM